MEQGTFQKRNLPYGYRWNEDHTNMVIDEETAQYVRLMFQWKIEGWSIQTILNELDRLGAPNTELRKRQNGTRKGDGCSCKGWYSSTLYGILSNPHYVGDTVLGRSMKAIYKGIKSHNVKDKDKWIVFPNTHEALISREDFQKVQDILQAASEARQTSMQKTEEIRATLVNLFEGKIVCADCGKKMYFHRKRIDKDKRKRWYAYYECSTSVGRRYEHCTSHYTRQDTLEANVLAAIQLQVEAALDYDKLLDAEEERYQTYFLNPVDEADLMALLEDDSQNTPVVCSCTEKCTAGKVNTNCALCKTDMTNCAGKEATPEETEQPDEPTPEKNSNVGGILILVLILAAGGGGTLWYFKLRKPKSSVKGGDELDEFDFDEDDEAEEYGDYEDADSASDPDKQENEE